jgi:hypothetical protein
MRRATGPPSSGVMKGTNFVGHATCGPPAPWIQPLMTLLLRHYHARIVKHYPMR